MQAPPAYGLWSLVLVERDALEHFGEAYARYAETTPAFWARLRGPGGAGARRTQRPRGA